MAYVVPGMLVEMWLTFVSKTSMIMEMWWDSSHSGMLPCRAVHCLGEADQEGTVVQLPSLWGNTWNVLSSVSGWMTSESGAASQELMGQDKRADKQG